ncbi:MAG: hypothetical protein ACT4TC_00545 [Myxococcaceae bacterium]
MRQYAAVALFDLGEPAGRRAVDQLLKGDLAAEFWRDRSPALGE